MTSGGFGWAGLIGLSAGMALLGAAPGIAAAIPAGVLTGFGYITATITFTTTIQADVPEQLRGRVMALWTVAFLGPRVVAAVVDGSLADAVGPHVTAAVFALPALGAAWFVRRTSPPPPGAEPVAPAA